MNYEKDNVIGNLFKKIRDSLDKNIKEMASELNIKPFELKDIELGNSLPSVELLLLIKEKYNIETNSFIEYVKNQQQKRKYTDVNTRKVTICYTRDIKSHRK